MAKYMVRFSCGHSEEMELLGPIKIRTSRIRQYEKTGLCKNCYKAMKEAERKDLSKKAGRAFGEPPELKGSEKQVHWAVTLRQDFLNHAYTTAQKNGGTDSRTKDVVTWILRTKTAARFWIDHREELTTDLFLSHCIKEYFSQDTGSESRRR